MLFLMLLHGKDGEDGIAQSYFEYLKNTLHSFWSNKFL